MHSTAKQKVAGSSPTRASGWKTPPVHPAVKDEIEGKKTSLLAQMYDRNRILVMLPIMWLNIS